MLDSIKTSFFYRLLFSFVYEKTKLKLAKYNKNLQNKICINLNNYRYFTGKIIILENNPKGKEYYLDKLVFEGEYLNGERNGKGKEYYENGKIKFEGEYSKGKRNGKGREFDLDTGNLLFYGEYFNGKKWNGIEITYHIFNWNRGKKFSEIEYIKGKKWNIKIFDVKGNIIQELINGNGIISEYESPYILIFEGEYKNGERNGKGKEYEIGKVQFEGEYLNGKKNGKGKEFEIIKEPLFEVNNLNEKGKDKSDIILFEGTYFDGKRWNGIGYDHNHNKIYELIDGNGKIIDYFNGKIFLEGNLLNGEKNGKFKKYDYGGRIVFEGNYSNGLKYGKGKSYYQGDLRFDAEYLDGKLYGKGKEYCNGQLLFDGEYLYNFRIKGKNYLDGKLEYEGDYLYNKKINGKGYDKDGNIIYELINGTGKVKEYNKFTKQLIFDGELLNGKKNGKAKEYTQDGRFVFDGEYLNGKEWNGRKKEYKDLSSTEYEYKNGEKIFKNNW